MSTRLLASILFLLGAIGPLTAQDLAARAAAARAAAEAELAAGRERRLAEHEALTARLAAAQRELQAAREAATTATTTHARLRHELERAEAERAKREARLRRLHEQLERLADGSADAETALAERLRELHAASTIAIAEREVLDRDGRPQRVAVIDLGALRLAAGDRAATAGLLRSTVDGTPLIAGPEPDAAGRQALQRVASGSPARIPLDVEGSLVARPPAAPWSVRGWLDAGGFFVWPILLVAGAAVILFGERLTALTRLRAPPALARQVCERLDAADTAGAQALVATRRTPMARVLDAGIATWTRTRPAREAALESALLAEELRLERGLKVLAVLAAVAPLLGLLGTVTGMIGTFEVISVHGTGNPRLLSGGISEALITTQLGLIVAVPILVLHAVLGRVVERRQTLLEQGATALLGDEQTSASSRAPAGDEA